MTQMASVRVRASACSVSARACGRQPDHPIAVNRFTRWFPQAPAARNALPWQAVLVSAWHGDYSRNAALGDGWCTVFVVDVAAWHLDEGVESRSSLLRNSHTQAAPAADLAVSGGRSTR